MADGKVLLWLWLSTISGPGSTLAERLMNAFGSDIEKIYSATPEEYASVGKINGREIEALSDKDLAEAREILAICQNENIGVITGDSPLYPQRLSRISSKPALIYYKGILTDLDGEICIAEVGTREMSEYGSRIAYSMAYDLAKAGAVVVSGMAKGVDGMAHRAALDAGGYTVAVMGCGLDRVYPSEHARLMSDIMKNGVIFSEFRPLTPPHGKNFPIRNRIISGLSHGTLVIEAPLRSGALITAREARKQGRDVFAMPGKIGEYNSSGTNQLIKDGAKIVTSAYDILLEYEMLYANKININNIPSFRSTKYFSPVKEKYGKVAPNPRVDKEQREGIVEAIRRSEIEMAEIEAEDNKKRKLRINGKSIDIGSAYAPEGSLGYLPENGVQPSGNVYGFNTVRDSSYEPTSSDIQAGTAYQDVRFGKGKDSPLPDTPFENPRGKIETYPREPVRKSDITLLTDNQRMIVKAFEEGGVLTADQLVQKTGIAIGDVLASLTMLEIYGWVIAMPGGLYRAV